MSQLSAASARPLNAAALPAPTRAAVRAPTPPELADVALIDGPRIAAAACMGLSAFYDEVRAGKAPPPVIRQPRCTRWRLADVREWLRQRAEAGSTPEQRSMVASAARAATVAAARKRSQATVGA